MWVQQSGLCTEAPLPAACASPGVQRTLPRRTLEPCARAVTREPVPSRPCCCSRPQPAFVHACLLRPRRGARWLVPPHPPRADSRRSECPGLLAPRLRPRRASLSWVRGWTVRLEIAGPALAPPPSVSVAPAGRRRHTRPTLFRARASAVHFGPVMRAWGPSSRRPGGLQTLSWDRPRAGPSRAPGRRRGVLRGATGVGGCWTNIAHGRCDRGGLGEVCGGPAGRECVWRRCRHLLPLLASSAIASSLVFFRVRARSRVNVRWWHLLGSRLRWARSSTSRRRKPRPELDSVQRWHDKVRRADAVTSAAGPGRPGEARRCLCSPQSRYVCFPAHTSELAEDGG